ncbi:MAG TPA: alpha/beta hydrolase, partial [Ramlibacter sp.]|nr:alpha/beta hydrolase [Ramlibacter sp.]
GITLSCRATGQRGAPVLVFLHGFPEAAFVWDELLEHFALPENGGYRCVAPNLRGYEKSSQPGDVKQYRVKYLLQDIAGLIGVERKPLHCLIAHDWGGAVAWNLANQMPELTQKLAIINSPHPGTFLRDLKSSPQQQAASAYMNFLIRPDAEQLLREDDYRRLWEFFRRWSGAPWLTPSLEQQYREVWDASLTGGLNYYRASPLRPAAAGDAAAQAIDLPTEMLTISVPTLVLWAMEDAALLPGLVEGLDGFIPQLTLEKVAGASHWIVHEQPALVAQRLGRFIAA